MNKIFIKETLRDGKIMGNAHKEILYFTHVRFFKGRFNPDPSKNI